MMDKALSEVQDKARSEVQGIIDHYDGIFKRLDDKEAKIKSDSDLSELDRDTKLIVLRAVRSLANDQGVDALLKWKEAAGLGDYDE